jgi:hypothetical protein
MSVSKTSDARDQNPLASNFPGVENGMDDTVDFSVPPSFTG